MANLNDRKDAFENKYAHDQELMFKIEARTAKLFGLWAAQQMGMDEAAADAYAKEIVGVNLDSPGFDDIKSHVMKDFEAKGVTVSSHVADRQLEECLEEAKKQIVKS